MSRMISHNSHTTATSRSAHGGLTPVWIMLFPRETKVSVIPRWFSHRCGDVHKMFTNITDFHKVPCDFTSFPWYFYNISYNSHSTSQYLHAILQWFPQYSALFRYHYHIVYTISHIIPIPFRIIFTAVPHYPHTISHYFHLIILIISISFRITFLWFPKCSSQFTIFPHHCIIFPNYFAVFPGILTSFPQ